LRVGCSCGSAARERQRSTRVPGENLGVEVGVEVVEVELVPPVLLLGHFAHPGPR